jgi:hypothetical protein
VMLTSSAGSVRSCTGAARPCTGMHGAPGRCGCPVSGSLAARARGRPFVGRGDDTHSAHAGTISQFRYRTGAMRTPRRPPVGRPCRAP